MLDRDALIVNHDTKIVSYSGIFGKDTLQIALFSNMFSFPWAENQCLLLPSLFHDGSPTGIMAA